MKYFQLYLHAFFHYNLDVASYFYYAKTMIVIIFIMRKREVWRGSERNPCQLVTKGDKSSSSYALF